MKPEGKTGLLLRKEGHDESQVPLISVGKIYLTNAQMQYKGKTSLNK